MAAREIAPFQLNPLANAQPNYSAPYRLRSHYRWWTNLKNPDHFFFPGAWGLIKVSFGLHYLNIKYPHFLLFFFTPRFAKKPLIKKSPGEILITILMGIRRPFPFYFCLLPVSPLPPPPQPTSPLPAPPRHRWTGEIYSQGSHTGSN